MQEVWSELWFGARLLVLAVATMLLGLWYRVGLRFLPVWAIVRAAFQLALIALILRAVLTIPWTVVAFVALMLTTASITSLRRIDELWHGRSAAVLGVLSGAGVSLGAIFLLGLAELEARYIVATGGIIIGSTMTAVTLAGRNFLRASRSHAGEVEAWFALGATPAVAHADLAREAVRESLIPNLDQSKSTGLVTLPGAFVGALFGGATPVEAAEFQLVVLAGIGLAMMVTSVVVTTIAARTPYLMDTHA